MANIFYRHDLPGDLDLGPVVAIDCESMGLKFHRDRLCLVQLSSGDGDAHLVRIERGQTDAPHLCEILANPSVLKLFHYGRFDMGILQYTFDVVTSPVYCTKIASKIARTYTESHGLKDLVFDLLDDDSVSKQRQQSDWGKESISPSQETYAGNDVLHLHKLREILDGMLVREGRMELAKACFNFLQTRVALDLAGWEDMDVFRH